VSSVFAEKICRLWFALRHRSAFAAIGRQSYIVSPFRIDGADSISIGTATFVQRGSWLYCQGIEGKPAGLVIGNRCVFGYNNHITAVRDVVIGDDVLTANNVFIADNVHGYEDIDTPIIDQPVRFRNRTSIGSGSWIGENACIIGASVGKNCVVSANAVVTHDVPDYCVVAGVPASIIRRFDPEKTEWARVSSTSIESTE
jgi:acetyltransferase-like isoleucine patch superfamily enzyme